MADRPVPVTVGRSRRAEPAGTLGRALGDAAAETLSHLIDVVDREDRLESGTGRFRRELSSDERSRRRTVEEAVLRSLRMASDPVNYHILETLTGSGQASTAELGRSLGLPRLAVEERISDLVSAGLAAKVFSAGQVAGTEAGAALVEMVRQAVTAGATGLESE